MNYKDSIIIVVGIIGLPSRFVHENIKNPYFSKKENPFKLQKLKRLKSNNRFRRK